MSTRVAFSWFGEAARDHRVVAGLARDGNTGRQLALLAPGWLHGCMGLNVAVRHHAWFQRWMAWPIAAVVALPLLAAAGSRSMLAEVRSPGLVPVAQSQPIDLVRRATLGALREHLLLGYFGLLARVFASRGWRDWRSWTAQRAQKPSL